MALAPATRLGPYEIIALIGTGGMGEVYRARDTRLGRDVAVKVLSSRLSASPEVRARFERESRAISQLNHPNICTLYDVGRQDDVEYLVMEYLEGETLAARLAKGPLPVAEVLRYGIEIANALDAAHRAGIVHRDLKPGNVMLTKSGAKLMDFGLARATGLTPIRGALTESPTVSRPLTAEGTIVGTFQYMAPEQLEGKDADPRTDMWALGCVLYEMATGKRAFEGTSQASLIAAILKETPRSMAELQPLAPPALERIARRCLQKDPEDRFQSASDLAFALEGLSGGSKVALPVVTDGIHRGKWRVVKAAVTLGLAAALVGAGFYFASRLAGRRPAPPTFTRLTFERGLIDNARFAPDGKSILYSAVWEGGSPEVFEARADLSTTRALGLPGVFLSSVSSTGELAVRKQAAGFFWDYGTLAVVHSPGSAPRDLLQDVSCADWSPDGSTLAVVRRAAGEDNLEMPPGHVLVKTSGWFSDVRVSPDGRRVAFVEHSILFDDRGSIAVADTAGRKTMLTEEFSTVSGLAWPQGGREIWFSAQGQPNGWRRALFAVTLEGRLRPVARFPSSVAFYDVSPDGRVLLAAETMPMGIRGRSFADEKERELSWLDHPWPRALSTDGSELLFDDLGETAGPTYTVYFRKMDGSPPVRLGEGSGCALSPDGRWALAIHFGPPHRLIMIPTGSGETLSLPRGSLETYQTADFLQDGRRIVFVGAEPGRPRRTWVQDFPDGLPSAVTPEGAVGIRTSPDGRWVAAVTKNLTLMLFPLRGGEPKQVAKVFPRDGVSQWTADGKTLFIEHPGRCLEVFSIDVQSGEKRLWKTFELADPAGVQMTSFAVTRDARSYAYGYFRVLDELYLVEGLK